ncbi:ATP-grasp domain-containing protein [Bacilli bacterium]|nr:carbamoyl-phosphate-synthetase [Bacilli bacterium VT-13-104]PZD84325.1 ATP-grasp domain-containing protein [Bacilli bacterium]PZD86018.1 ATP-grasp domain-containing protein [Bacilli bacterium]PZD89240.1 ATP-grasp domain-containing protein [Bacilli bacterium]RCO05206.1 ATP-grasp domain-containing protein [Bacilli bacterium]
MRKLLLLGGSKQQVPAIQYAKEKGLYTILCDYLPDNPGQHYAEEFYCVSTTDKEAILKVAVNNNIDGILAYASDPAAPTAAYVAEKMGLPTNPYKSVELLSNKDEFRSFLAKHNFNTPKAKGYSSIEEAKREIESFKLPVIIKPVDSSGSKGVSKLTHAKNLASQIEYALSFSRAKKVIVEEYVEMQGYQVAGDGFSVDGKLMFRCFANDHFNSKGLNSFVPVSASFPYEKPERIHKKIHNEIQRLLDLLEMKTGAYNFDVRIDKNENVYLMEIGPRNGGNYIPQVIRYATGIDMLDFTIRAAMGEDCSDIKMIETKGYWSYFAVHSSEPGVLKDIKIKESVNQNNIVESHMIYKIGDNIPAFTGANGNIGILIMKFESMNEMLHMMDNPEEWIEIIVK